MNINPQIKGNPLFITAYLTIFSYKVDITAGILTFHYLTLLIYIFFLACLLKLKMLGADIERIS